jgi:hypothetical protein
MSMSTSEIFTAADTRKNPTSIPTGAVPTGAVVQTTPAISLPVTCPSLTNDTVTTTAALGTRATLPGDRTTREPRTGAPTTVHWAVTAINGVDDNVNVTFVAEPSDRTGDMTAATTPISFRYTVTNALPDVTYTPLLGSAPLQDTATATTTGVSTTNTPVAPTDTACAVK